MTKVSILMATTDGKLMENQSFFQLPFDENFTAIVVNQKIHSDKELTIENPYVKVYNVKEKGISRSRNYAVEKADAEYVHFCDDDVVFLPNYLSTILKSIESYPETDFFRFQIASTDGGFFKNYTTENYIIHTNNVMNRRKILFISSIEIIGKLQTIKEKNLRFDTHFGIGSGQYPMGEEAIFLLNALEKGCSIRYIPEAIVAHEPGSSGKNLGVLYLKTLGILFKKVFGNWYLPFSFYYALKKKNMLKKEGISVKKAFEIMKNNG